MPASARHCGGGSMRRTRGRALPAIVHLGVLAESRQCGGRSPPGALNINGKRLTQLELKRLPESQRDLVDSALREIEQRLLAERRA